MKLNMNVKVNRKGALTQSFAMIQNLKKPGDPFRLSALAVKLKKPSFYRQLLYY
jgi:hypothetical protein